MSVRCDSPAPTAASAPLAAPLLPPDPAALDRLLDRITAIKSQQKQLDIQLESLVDQLDGAFEAGLLDPSFSHNDVSFCWSAGRTTYIYPEVLQQREQALKAAQKDAIANGAATARAGKPFWMIRLPRD